MAKPTTRQGLQDYCLKQLGSPVIEINIDPDQMEDSLDDAIQYWQEFHADATFKTYVAHKLTDSDVTNRFIPIDDEIISVNGMFAIPLNGFGFNDIKYDLFASNTGGTNVGTTNLLNDLAYYEQVQMHLSLVEQRLNGVPQTTYSRHQDRLYIHGDVGRDLLTDNYVMYEAYKIVNTTDYSDVYNDMWLKEYATALFKRQWGSNLSKFSEMQLPGGVTLNGVVIFEQATADIARLRDKIRLDHEEPTDFFVG